MFSAFANCGANLLFIVPPILDTEIDTGRLPYFPNLDIAFDAAASYRTGERETGVFHDDSMC